MTDTRPAPDLDLRLVRYFVAVAEHANFGRAADALHLAQPSLSRQVQRLEQQLGTRLFDRTPRGSRLTDAGTAFLPRARALLAQARQATAAVREAGASRTFTVGYTGDVPVGDVARELRSRLPGTVVRTRRVHDGGAARALHDRTVDGLITRLPLPTSGLRVVPLRREERVLVVSSGHPLAGRDAVTPGDLDDQPRVSCGVADQDWTAFWRLDGDAGAPVPLAPWAVDGFEDKLELVAAGEAIAILPGGDRRLGLWPGVVTVPVVGVEPVRVVAAYRDVRADAATDAFVEAAARTLARGAERRTA